jgi:hypothetical protein
MSAGADNSALPMQPFPHSSVSAFGMNLDKHRESLVKYCYDISKVGFALTVLNPL